MNTLLDTIQNVFLADDPLGRAIVGFIFLLTGIGVAISIWLIVQARRETDRARLIAGLDNLNEQTRAQLLEDHQKGVLGSRLRLLEDCRTRQQPINQDTLSAVSRSEIEGGRPTQFVRFLAGILIIIGLLGTFIGFAVIVAEARDILSGIETQGSITDVIESITHSIGQIDTAMRGLTIAFSTSIAGILGTLLVSAANLGVDCAQTRALRMLETVTASHLLPLFAAYPEQTIQRVLTSLEGQSENLAGRVGKFSQVVEKGIESISDRMQEMTQRVESEEKVFSSAVNTIRETVANTAQVVATTLDTSTKNFADSIERARKESEESINQIGDLIDELEATIGKAGTTFETGVSNTAGVFSSTVQSSGEHLEQHLRQGALSISEASTRVSQSFDSSATTLSTAVRSSGELLTEHLREGATAISTASTVAGASIEQGGQAFGAEVQQASQAWTLNTGQSAAELQRRVEQAGTSLVDMSKQSGSELRAALLETVAALPEIVRGMQALTEQSRESNLALKASVDDLTQAMEGTDRRILELNVDGRSFVDIIAELAQVMLARETNLQASQILFDEWIDRSATALEQVTHHFGDRLTGDLEGLRQDVQQAGGLLQGTATSLQQNLQGTSTDLQRTLQGAATGLQQTSGQVSQAVADLKAIARQLARARDRATPPPIPRPPETGIGAFFRRLFGLGDR